MSFGFNTSLEQAEQAHLEMEATTAPPPLPPGAPATAVAPPVAVPAAPAPAAPKKQQSFKALDRVDARFQKGELWYPGTIATALPGDKYDIAYDDGDREYAVPAALIRKATVAPVDITSSPSARRRRHRRRPRRRRRRGEEVVEPAGRGAEPGRAAAAAVWLGHPAPTTRYTTDYVWPHARRAGPGASGRPFARSARAFRPQHDPLLLPCYSRPRPEAAILAEHAPVVAPDAVAQFPFRRRPARPVPGIRRRINGGEHLVVHRVDLSQLG